MIYIDKSVSFYINMSVSKLIFYDFLDILSNM